VSHTAFNHLEEIGPQGSNLTQIVDDLSTIKYHKLKETHPHGKAIIRGHRSVLPPSGIETFAPDTERRPKYRGAWTEVIGKISHTANSAVVLRRDTLKVTGSSYPIGSVPDRPRTSVVPLRVRSQIAGSGLGIRIVNECRQDSLCAKHNGIPSKITENCP
jgi:hypothetical protein